MAHHIWRVGEAAELTSLSRWHSWVRIPYASPSKPLLSQDKRGFFFGAENTARKAFFAFRAVFISEISFFLSDFDLRQTAFGGFTISSGDIPTGISHGDDHIIQRDLSRITEKTG